MSAPNTGLAPAQPQAQPDRYGEIYDRGYKHYDGPRLGRRHAVNALVRYSIKRALGIKKSWTAKVIPILLYVAVALPVIISVGIRAFAPNAGVLDYPDFFAIIFILEGIFVATIAPEMLCGDRRENVLPLYFSRAIARTDYLVAKLLATAILTLTMSLVPAALLWLFRQFLEGSPFTEMKNHIGDLGRIFVAGTMIALYLGAISLVISSFTGRKSIAVAVIILGFLMTESLAGALVAAIDDANDKYLNFLSPTSTTGGLVGRLFDASDSGIEVDIWLILGEMAAVILVSCAVMYWRYVPNE